MAYRLITMKRLVAEVDERLLGVDYNERLIAGVDDELNNVSISISVADLVFIPSTLLAMATK
ncbi:hypothetical protein TorRG33x02_295850 [Trema orientale]|uniref:Uncharacterized protein n=1 Tax=Trema orientale TaxID=63057 RepID=A0A2P5C6P4_TREOI|nr:hypothetical protein TorRG33x02_295850 [Trema orientale]